MRMLQTCRVIRLKISLTKQQVLASNIYERFTVSRFVYLSTTHGLIPESVEFVNYWMNFNGIWSDSHTFHVECSSIVSIVRCIFVEISLICYMLSQDVSLKDFCAWKFQWCGAQGEPSFFRFEWSCKPLVLQMRLIASDWEFHLRTGSPFLVWSIHWFFRAKASFRCSLFFSDRTKKSDVCPHQYIGEV